VETLLPLMLTQVAEGRLSLERMVQLTSENPARIYGHYPRKGSLLVGADADFVLVDLQQRWTLRNEQLHSKHKVMPYDGWTAVGRPVATYLRGRQIVQEGEPLGAPSGQFIRPGYGSRA
jgi:dihydroorotase-like cyclic amidohydrolase